MPNIEFSHFEGFEKDGDGGVLSVENIDLTITCCSFTSNSATKNGGSIYLSKCHLNITKTEFYKSKSTANTDNIAGNALYLKEDILNIQDVSASLCSDSNDARSDSAIRSLSTNTTVKNYNASHNSGVGGASSISIHLSPVGSSVSYTNVYDVLDNCAIESWSSCYTVKFSNFIKFNPRYNKGIVAQKEANSFTFIQCSFFETDTLSITAYSESALSIIDCYSDRLLPSITQTTEFTTISIDFDIHCNNISIQRPSKTGNMHIIHKIVCIVSLFVLKNC